MVCKIHAETSVDPVFPRRQSHPSPPALVLRATKAPPATWPSAGACYCTKNNFYLRTVKYRRFTLIEYSPNIDAPTPWILQLQIMSSFYTECISCMRLYKTSSTRDRSIHTHSLQICVSKKSSISHICFFFKL